MKISLTNVRTCLVAAVILSVTACAAPVVKADDGSTVIFKNKHTSAKSINVYSERNCHGTRWVVKAGHSHRGHSTKVNAYSDIYINEKLVASHGPKNVCSSNSALPSTVETIYVYPGN